MVKTILFLAANPLDTDRLRLDVEVREIDNGLRGAKQREKFVLQQKWALRTEDLRRAMLDFEPEIVHFSGHGAGISGIILEDSSGDPKLVSAEALQDFFGIFPNVRCVLLNACYSEIQAKAIAESVEIVIGIPHQINDIAAREFSLGFYDALGAGKTFEFAYKLGCNAIKMLGKQEHLLPVLIRKSAITGKQMGQELIILSGGTETKKGDLLNTKQVELHLIKGDSSLAPSLIKLSRKTSRLGREPAKVDIPILDRQISSSHCRITEHNQEYRLFDDGSANGTFLNYKPVDFLGQILRHNDVISIGPFDFRFIEI